jgi:hypothetical protein
MSARRSFNEGGNPFIVTYAGIGSCVKNGKKNTYLTKEGVV